MNAIKLLFDIRNVFGAIIAFVISVFVLLALISAISCFLLSQMDAIFGDGKFETWQIVADATLVLSVLVYFVYREYKKL